MAKICLKLETFDRAVLLTVAGKYLSSRDRFFFNHANEANSAYNGLKKNLILLMNLQQLCY